ncbi:pentapeptide repeat-containing protein [Streptomyces specialis]|uniref:pentapeptide repeat-containing protein n=1 Tax=Streptomyces specialis TaxID=498367 RepID=UPI00073E4E78|nr:pentapeptide repeat-containing protein [Streptomyces specialis]
MDSRTLGRITVSLPALDDPDLYLSNVASLEGGRGTVQDFRYADASLRELDLTQAHLVTGRISGLSAQRVRLDGLRVDSVEFDGCDLGSLHWSGSKLSRIVFRNCRLMGAALEQLTLDNVLFEGCRLDYATFDQVRASGPLAFVKCTLTEAAFHRCDLSGSHFEGCGLHLTEFDAGTYRDTDLRGNDLSALRGIPALKEVIIDRPQQAELAHALTAELGIVFADTLDDPE